MKKEILPILIISFCVFIAGFYAQELSTDPQGSGVILGAARWIQGALLGSVATVVAVIAVAVVGLITVRLR